MATGGDIRRCALDGCDGLVTSLEPHARFCSKTCRKTSSNAKRRRCKNCGVQLVVDSPFARHCSNACKWAYLEKRRRGRGRPEVLPAIAVLLPAGCKPRRGLPIVDEEQASSVRRVDCRRYDRCLSYAVSKGWASFGCGSCEVDERIGMFDRRRDMEAFADMWREWHVVRATPEIVDDQADDGASKGDPSKVG
jgi:hypothetical protein